MLIENVMESVEYIQSQTDYKPAIAIVLGSGLGDFVKRIEAPVMIPYGSIPHFVKSTAPGHKGQLVFGMIEGKAILCMQGRFHFYEGYHTQEITYPIRVMKKLGIEKLILTNASGGLNPEFIPGDLMVVTDHINFMGTNPLIGKNEEDFGPRFQDMTYGYDLSLRNALFESARELCIDLKEGVYLACTGPSFETPAEIRMFRSFGCNAVGMSTVPEVIAANHSGIKVCAVSCITNLAAGMLDQPLTEEEVIVEAGSASKKIMALLGQTVKKI